MHVKNELIVKAESIKKMIEILQLKSAECKNADFTKMRVLNAYPNLENDVKCVWMRQFERCQLYLASFFNVHF